MLYTLTAEYTDGSIRSASGLSSEVAMDVFQRLMRGREEFGVSSLVVTQYHDPYTQAIKLGPNEVLIAEYGSRRNLYFGQVTSDVITDAINACVKVELASHCVDYSADEVLAEFTRSR